VFQKRYTGNILEIGRNKFQKSYFSWKSTKDRKRAGGGPEAAHTIGAFPFTYLGFPMADRPLTMVEWEGLVGKVGHQVDPWQGRFMSSAARLTLINSSQSSLTMYAMGLFLLADGTHASFDKILARFFWEGVSDKCSYHWVMARY
jgi:hypothetical protein